MGNTSFTSLHTFLVTSDLKEAKVVYYSVAARRKIPIHYTTNATSTRPDHLNVLINPTTLPELNTNALFIVHSNPNLEMLKQIKTRDDFNFAAIAPYVGVNNGIVPTLHLYAASFLLGFENILPIKKHLETNIQDRIMVLLDRTHRSPVFTPLSLDKQPEVHISYWNKETTIETIEDNGKLEHKADIAFKPIDIDVSSPITTETMLSELRSLFAWTHYIKEAITPMQLAKAMCRHHHYLSVVDVQFSYLNSFLSCQPISEFALAYYQCLLHHFHLMQTMPEFEVEITNHYNRILELVGDEKLDPSLVSELMF